MDGLNSGPGPKHKLNEENILKTPYCKNCIWFRRSWIPPFIEKCIHPKNWKATWLKRVRRHPCYINRNNNCEWFEERLSEPKPNPY